MGQPFLKVEYMEQLIEKLKKKDFVGNDKKQFEIKVPVANNMPINSIIRDKRENPDIDIEEVLQRFKTKNTVFMAPVLEKEIEKELEIEKEPTIVLKVKKSKLKIVKPKVIEEQDVDIELEEALNEKQIIKKSPKLSKGVSLLPSTLWVNIEGNPVEERLQIEKEK